MLELNAAPTPRDSLSNEIYWSDEVYRTYGLAPSTLPTLEDAFHGYHPDDRARVEDLVARSIAQGTPLTHESRIVRADGSVRYIVSSGQAERTSDGTTVAVFGVFQDVTDATWSRANRWRRVHRHLTQYAGMQDDDTQHDTDRLGWTIDAAAGMDDDTAIGISIGVDQIFDTTALSEALIERRR